MTNQLIQTETTRRQLLAMATVGGAGVLGAVSARPASASGRDDEHENEHDGGKHHTLTVLGTTDLHGNVYNWNYYKNAEYDDKTHNDIGIAKAATLIKAMRAQSALAGCALWSPLAGGCATDSAPFADLRTNRRGAGRSWWTIARSPGRRCGPSKPRAPTLPTA